MKKRIQILLLFFAFVTVNTIKAQNVKLDSLENLLKIHPTEDTARVNLLNSIAYFVHKDDSAKTRSYATQALELSDQINYQKGKAESIWLLGLSYNRSNRPKSFEYLQKALQLSEAIDYKYGIIRCLNGIGSYYNWRKDSQKAIEYYQRGIKVSEGLSDNLELAKCLINLMTIYSSEGKYDQALKGYERAFEICKKFNDKSLMATCLNHIGVIYAYQGNFPLALECAQKNLRLKEEVNDKHSIFFALLNIADNYSDHGEFQNALEYVQKALKVAEELNDMRKISLGLANIGFVHQKAGNPEALSYLQKALELDKGNPNVTQTNHLLCGIANCYLQRGDYEKAMINYREVLRNSEESGKKRSVCEALMKTGTIYLKQKQFAQALSYTLKSLDVANEMVLLNDKKDIHNQLAEIYAATNDYKNAYLHHKLFKELNDSIFNEKNIRKLSELEFTYKNEKEKHVNDIQHTAEIKQQKNLVLSLIGGFILMLVLIAFVVRSNRFKGKTNLILTKQNDEIATLNEEYLAINEELTTTNDDLAEAKQLVEESEERLRLLIKNSNDIIVLVNGEGKQVFISDAAKSLTGYEVKELLGSLDDVIFPEDLEIVRQHWDRVLASTDVADSVQYRHKHKEKGYVWFEAVAQNFLDHHAIQSVVANVRDITERKNTELALQESEAAKAQLLTNEIERINRELELNQRSMTAATLKLIQNSERDAHTINRLIELEKDTNPEGKQKIKALICDNKRVSYNSNWDEFEILFEKVHSSFYEKLNTQFPNLTANERKICAFLKLNMSNKEIAHITFQSDDALKKARLRLRQKLEMDRETNLVAFLQNI